MYKFLVAYILLMVITFPKEVFMEKIKANNLEFDVRVAGLSNTGDAVILLHGFPQTSHMYQEIMGLLSDNNYKVIAPDQRGYSKGARPKSKNDYKIEYLVEDIFLLADEFSFKEFHLVGHDWGAAVGWGAVKFNPERIISWSALSVPHIDALNQAREIDKNQQKKSRYLKFFNLPFFPELYFSINNHKNLKTLWNKHSQSQKEEYMKVFSQKGALTAALNWYRANLNRDDIEKLGEIFKTTQFIWGNKDMALGRKGAELTKDYMRGEYSFIELDVGHWSIQEDYDTISSLILNFINKNSKK